MYGGKRLASASGISARSLTSATTRLLKKTVAPSIARISSPLIIRATSSLSSSHTSSRLPARPLPTSPRGFAIGRAMGETATPRGSVSKSGGGAAKAGIDAAGDAGDAGDMGDGGGGSGAGGVTRGVEVAVAVAFFFDTIFGGGAM